VAAVLMYTSGPFPLKYNALGDAAVFVCFSLLGALGAWVVQIESLSWIPVIWSLPLALLVAGILHANNWRDIRHDVARDVRTIASLLGPRRSRTYYEILIFGPFVLVVALVLLPGVGRPPAMPITFLVTLLALPKAFALHRVASAGLRDPEGEALVALDGQTAQLNLLFGVLCLVAVLLQGVRT
jgi:1,4-dihydroxy-2-naphthoate octaprenyltransferase